jgi:hypothetical protein
MLEEWEYSEVVGIVACCYDFQKGRPSFKLQLQTDLFDDRGLQDLCELD